MNNSTTVVQEPSPVYDLVSQLGRFAFSSRFRNLGSDGYSSFLSNFIYFDAFGNSSVSGKKPKFGDSLSLSSRSSSSIKEVVTQFNRAVRFHCERIPIGFASVRIGSGDNNNNNGSGNKNGGGDNNNNGLREEGCGVLEDDGLAMNGVEAENPKKVLILMSDTGGGHRASAEAIKAAFYEQFGYEYQVSYN